MQPPPPPGNIRRAVTRLLQCDQGMETLQAVMIIAIAAVCLIAVKVFWAELATWTRELTEIFFEA